jgi:hypothetical protein
VPDHNHANPTCEANRDQRRKQGNEQKFEGAWQARARFPHKVIDGAHRRENAEEDKPKAPCNSKRKIHFKGIPRIGSGSGCHSSRPIGRLRVRWAESEKTPAEMTRDHKAGDAVVQTGINRGSALRQLIVRQE